jgi:hypothetical protein
MDLIGLIIIHNEDMHEVQSSTSSVLNSEIKEAMMGQTCSSDGETRNACRFFGYTAPNVEKELGG